MKQVFVQPVSAGNGRFTYDLLDLNGGFVAGGLIEYATIGEAHDAGITHVQHFPDSFTLFNPAAVAALLADLLPYLHDIKTGFLEPKTQVVGYDQKTINELYTRLKEALK